MTADTGDRFTAQQRRMLAVLGDGCRHYHKELLAVADDELMSRETLVTAVYRLRKILKPDGYDILSTWFRGRFYYQLVILFPQRTRGEALVSS